MKKKIQTDSYGSHVPDGMTFDEYWAQQDKITELSYKESIRQRDDRREKKKYKNPTQ